MELSIPHQYGFSLRDHESVGENVSVTQLLHQTEVKLDAEVQFQPPHSSTRVCELSDAAPTVFAPKAAAVCTVHLSHNRSDSNSI